MRHAIQSLILALLAVVHTQPLLASEAGVGLYNLGNRHYSEGMYDLAIEAYEGAVDAGTANASLLYNLGNAHFKQGRLGLAILNYERGLKLDPRDEDLRFNLALARSHVKGSLEMPDKGILWKTLEWIYDLMTLNEAIFLLSALYLLFCACIILRILAKSHRARTPLFYVQSFCALLSLVTGILLYAKIHYEVLIDHGVLLDATVEARSGPGDEHTPIFPLYEGMTFEVHQWREGWGQVRLPNGLTGWITGEEMEVI